MAKLAEEILTRVFTIQRQLLERINEATEIEYQLLERFGETQETLDYFEQLQNSRERADNYYLRLFTSLRQIYPAQPVASLISSFRESISDVIVLLLSRSLLM